MRLPSCGCDAVDVGSIEKNVICLVIAILLQRGEIDIDPPMTTWLGPGWTQAIPCACGR